MAAEVPLLVAFFRDLWTRPQYQFFPFILLLAPYVAFERLRNDADEPEPGLPLIAGALVLASLAALAAGGTLLLRWAAPVSTGLALLAGIWAVGGRRLLRTLAPALVLLLTILPPPGHYEDGLLMSLRHAAVTLAGRVLDTLHVPNVLTGTVVEIPGDRLLVQEACSGINSMLAVLAFTLLYAFVRHLRGWTLMVLLPAAVAFVFWANVIRIAAGAVLKEKAGVDILAGTPHELLGLALFALSLGLVISTERLLARCTNARRESSLVARPTERKLPRRPGLVRWYGVALAFIAVAVAVHWRVRGAWVLPTLPDDASFALPEQLAGWTRSADPSVGARPGGDRGPGKAAPLERPEVNGFHPHFWVYRRGDRAAAIAVDYPFSGFHEATICYSTGGWDIARASVAAANAGAPAFYEVALAKPPLMIGRLLFASCDEAGHWLAADPPAPPAGAIATALYFSKRRAADRPTVQVQALAVGYQPIGPAQTAAVRELFLAARKIIAAEVAEQAAGHAGPRGNG